MVGNDEEILLSIHLPVLFAR